MSKFLSIILLVVVEVIVLLENRVTGECTEDPMPEEPGPVVLINPGYLMGTYMQTGENREFEAYLGIPYAKPPLRELRFQPPVPKDPWEGIKDAKTVHAVCPQRDVFRRSSLIEGDEDCLYLNVYTPESVGNLTIDVLPEDLFPVMIFFHGGGWLCGGGNSQWYGPHTLLDRDLVLVVPNYRLGALGFLSTGDGVVPGNNGLKDQNLVIRWVKENIKAFGGNPDLITLFGESAGGASVQLHMASPLSKGLFQRAISQSGTAHNLWALAPTDQGVRHSQQLARSFNCPIEDSKRMVECLRGIDAYSLVEKDKIFMKWDLDPMIPFKPVIEPDEDGAFLPEHPIDVLKAGKMAEVPWIVGLNTEDGALRAAGLFANPHLLDELNEDFHNLAPISLLYDETTSNNGFLTHKIRNYYFGDKKIDNTTQTEVVNMYTDGWFLSGIDEAVRFYIQYSKQPVYYYLFGHRGVSSFTKIFGDPHNDYGVCHADELQYLFPIGAGLFPDDIPTETDKKVTLLLTNLWVNFAQTGEPTPELGTFLAKRWNPVKNDHMDYLYIDGDNPDMQTGLLLDRANFWRQLRIHSRRMEIKDEL